MLPVTYSKVRTISLSYLLFLPMKMIPSFGNRWKTEPVPQATRHRKNSENFPAQNTASMKSLESLGTDRFLAVLSDLVIQITNVFLN